MCKSCAAKDTVLFTILRVTLFSTYYQAPACIMDGEPKRHLDMNCSQPTSPPDRTLRRGTLALTLTLTLTFNPNPNRGTR